jgi:hypothetical protein
MAAFFPGVDVSGGNGALAATEPLGLLHRVIGGWALGLHQPVCDHVPAQRAALDISLDQHRLAQARRSDRRCARLDREPPGGDRFHLGLCAPAGKAVERSRAPGVRVCSDDGLLRCRDGVVPAEVPAALSRDASSAPALVSALVR